MGQYHTIYNTTKKESLNLGGAKLWEKAHNNGAMMALLVLTCNSNGRGGGDFQNPIREDFYGKNMNRLKTPKYIDNYGNKKTKKQFDEIEEAIKLISGRWAGDKIVVQGDYVEKTDKSFIRENQLKKYKDISGIVKDALKKCLSSTEDNEILNNLD